MTDEQSVKQWYNERHRRDGAKAWRDPEHYDVFLQHLDVQPGKKLLDIGSGTGFLLKKADERGLETYGVDISEEGIALAQQNSPRSKLAVAPGEDLPFASNMFDYISCIGVLEHFSNMPEGLSEMRRVTKPHASLCIVVPNRNYWYWKLKKERGTEQQSIRETVLPLSDWKALFAQAGFNIRSVHQDTWPRDSMRMENYPRPLDKMKIMGHKLVWSVMPLSYTYQFIFILKSK